MGTAGQSVPDRGGPPPFTIPELADRWRLPQSSIRQAIRAGEIKALKVGGSFVIPVSEVERCEAGAAS
jgi:excisionase family DNA binding protein